MELIYYIDVPSIPDYWITSGLNTAFYVHASIWYTEMKKIHGRRNWSWCKSQIIQKYRNGTWIWKKTMSFENDTYLVDKDPYEWCFRQSKRLKTIYPHMNIQMRNYKLPTQMLGELENAVKCRCNQICTLDDIANTLQDVRKRTNIGKYSQYKSSSFKEKQPFRVDLKDKPKERVAEVTKKKILGKNCGSQTTIPITVKRQRKKSMKLRKSQRKNHQQNILTQSQWVMPPANLLMMTKTQRKNF
ncbi:hypothetical protein O181_041752 [Austropuccinia psidii MF-1]|uniref:Uncharacterized protein n=1 Tax=Austropuccinia psidii MF-1 TaxID=1389203 RepID=A0A9Q3DLD7_9BASI|nr:hypothetical protein [Austropuccinia psidii MF-1]